MQHETLKLLLILCGYGHIALCIGSLLIPKLLNWKKELQDLQPLLRQMFWTYAAYILVINLCFGLVSIFGADELLNHSFLAKSVSLFIGLYWLARVFIQFLYFDKTHAPQGLIYTLGEVGLVGLFVVFTVVYLAVFGFNVGWLVVTG
jgi:hypothetical protein